MMIQGLTVATVSAVWTTTARESMETFGSPMAADSEAQEEAEVSTRESSKRQQTGSVAGGDARVRSSRTKHTGALVDFLAASGLTAVVSDKEGFFVVMEEGAFLEKGAAAVHKNFHKVRDEPTKIGYWPRNLPARALAEKVQRL
ncbi:hypothetical protein MTO96_003476 [Rhipicephalus appendiculatus]